MSSSGDLAPPVPVVVASTIAGGGATSAAEEVDAEEPGTPSKRNSVFVAFTIGVAVRKMQANFRGKRARDAMVLLQKSKSFKHLLPTTRAGPTRRTSNQYKSLWKRGITQVMENNKEMEKMEETLSEEQEKAATLAAYYVEDAFAGRLSNGKAVMSLRDAFTFRCFNIHVHKVSCHPS